MKARQAGWFMRAFGDGTRLRIVAALTQHRLSVAELTELLGCPKPRVSRHLSYLQARGVVESQAVANSVVYRLARAGHALHRNVLEAVQRGLHEVEEARRDAAQLAARSRRSRGRGRTGQAGIPV